MIRINENGDLVREERPIFYDDGNGLCTRCGKPADDSEHPLEATTLATAAELKAAFAEKGMVIVERGVLTALAYPPSEYAAPEEWFPHEAAKEAARTTLKEGDK